MTTYGFRLHTITAHAARTRDPLDFGSSALPDCASLITEQLNSLKGRAFARDATYKDLETGAPEADTLPARTPVMRVDDVQRSGNRLEVVVSYGRVGDYTFAMSPAGGPDLSLEGSAAARTYRNVVYFPRAGTSAVMVSGTKGRTFTGEVLFKRLSVENARAAAGSDDQGAWIRWVPRVLIDDHRIEEVAERGKLEGLRLRRHGIDATGTRHSQDLTLTQNGVRESDRPLVRDMLKRWVRKAANVSMDFDPSLEVAALSQLVDADVGGVGFNDGVLSFSEDGKTQTIGPSNLAKILVYPLGSDEPSASELRSKAVSRLRPLTMSMGIPVDLT